MESGAAAIHTPVLLSEVVEYLNVHSDGIYVDGTLGMGGHSEAILRASSPNGRVVAFDWDEEAIRLARQRLERFGSRLNVIRRNFAELASGMTEVGLSEIDGLLIDIGLSSLQLDKGGRGFSFQRDEPLDMRMDNRRKMTAESVLAGSSEQELADIIFYYGEEKQSRRIAAEIVKARKQERIHRSFQLAEIVARAIPKRFHPRRIHVATKTFQALRIAVNTELENLATILDSGISFLKPGGRFCVITFHSLEDRIVKRKFRESRDLEILTGKPITASQHEIERNPRSRSAKLRVACRKG